MLLWALAYFFEDMGLIAALLPAVAVHELGHAAVLRRCGARVTGLELELTGLRMDYAGPLSPGEEALAALAGPLAGLGWTLLARALPGTYFHRSAAASLCLTALNLLPVLPLDGGRALSALAGERRAGTVSRCCAALFTAAGAAAALLGRSSLILPAAGLWLWMRNRGGYTAKRSS